MHKHIEQPVMLNEKYRYLACRGYSNRQLGALRSALPDRYWLAFDLATKVGLRIREMNTLSKDDDGYFVSNNAGALVRISIPCWLATRLEEVRQESEIVFKDRYRQYTTHYSINNGNCFAVLFNKLSHELFGWSLGTQKLRVTYAANEFERLSRKMPARLALNKVKMRLGKLD
ncbi:hypothetical protein [Photobacterium leiognathi]|uniref:hypothetical protein n=1 Tax=Photobacterium leiognathi TaxID=553611 RepID=UPI0029827AF0|nr:hypothetical protein [Photobacterium leiognathi]